MAPLSSASGSVKREHPGDKTPGSSKRHDHHTYSAPLTFPESDDDVDEGNVDAMDDRPYSEAQEAFPQRPAFDKALWGLDKKIESLTKQLQSTLGKHCSVSRDLQNIKSKADDAVAPLTPDRLMVAMVGATGAGKSSLLNTVTDTPHLAKALSAGESCTSVPTVYMHRLPWQTLKFAAEISYYDIEHYRKLLDELLRQYNLYHFECDEEWTSSQRNEYSQHAETAMATFRTLFRDQEEFETQRAAEYTLSHSYDGGLQRELLALMTVWCENFFVNHAKEDGAGYTRCETETVADLRAYIDPLTAPSHFHKEASLWPLVESVRTGVPRSRVLKWVSIVDLPGITDTNQLRVNTTHDYIRKCQALWYVAAVDRICTDPDLERTISDYAERFPGALAIVVTKIDEGITDELTAEMTAKGHSIGDYEETKVTISGLKDVLKQTKHTLKTATLTSEARHGWRDQEDKVKEEIHREESKIFECLVDARNDYIGDRLRADKKKHLPPGAQLPIQFVSNKQYNVHKQIIESEGPSLEIASTGISGLRSYALCLAASGAWNAYEEQLMFKRRVLFRGVNIWVQGSVGNPEYGGLMDCVNTVFNVWQVRMSESIEQTTSEFGAGIIQSLRAAHAASMQGAMRWFETITSPPWWAHTFWAFYKKDGKHRTSVIAEDSWNERFIENQTREVLNPGWKENLPSAERYFDTAVSELKKAINDLPAQLAQYPGSVLLPMEAFQGVLDAQNEGIKAAHHKQKLQYQQDLSNIKLDATLDHHTAHFTQAMQPCYDERKTDKGAKVCTRIKTTVHNYLLQQDPLSRATDLLADALESNTYKHARSLDTDVQRILVDVSHQFRMILQRGPETPKEKQARRKIGLFLKGAMPDIESIERDLAKIRQKYPGM